MRCLIALIRDHRSSRCAHALSILLYFNLGQRRPVYHSVGELAFALFPTAAARAKVGLVSQRHDLALQVFRAPQPLAPSLQYPTPPPFDPGFEVSSS